MRDVCSRVQARALAILIVVAAAACGSAGRDGFGASSDADDAGARAQAIVPDAGKSARDGGRDAGKKDAGVADDLDADTGLDASAGDGGASLDGGLGDGGSAVSDSGAVVVTGPVTGGPCASGAAGAAAFRARWINGAGRATASYEVNGLPDKSRSKMGAYGYSIGFNPSFVDPYLGPGGVGLDGSDFIDIEISTAGLSQIHAATLAIYGRSYDTTASGSFSWQTAHGSASTVSGAVSNVAPYAWYGADVASELPAGDANLLVRVKAGPPSGSLVVSRIELCLDAD